MQNHIEKEAKILEVDKAAIIVTLERHGAKKILDAITVIETYDLKGNLRFKKPKDSAISRRFSPILDKIGTLTNKRRTLLAQGAYLRLRREGPHLELILKYRVGVKNEHVKSEREMSVEVRSAHEWKAAQNLLRQCGLAQIFYQEKQRVSYLFEPLTVRFDIDTWPGVPTYVEIEGKSQTAIQKAARLLGYNVSHLSSYKAADVFRKYSVSPVYLSFSQGAINVRCDKLLEVIQTILNNYGLSKKDANFIARHYWEAELMGKKTHGVRKFCWDFQYYNEKKGKPKILRDSKAVALVDGCREIGPLAAQFCINLVGEKAKRYGIGMVGLKNFQRYGILSSWTRAIAYKDLIGIVSNSTENFVVSPSKKIPVLGTNPISIGFPNDKKPIILDMSTGKKSMSLIWHERLHGGELPKQTFIDIQGEYTTNPWAAKWVDVWGGLKGFNLSFMLQLLNGPLLGVKTELTWEDPYEVGAVFIAINPKLFRSIQEYKKDILDFINFQRKHIAMLPGEKSHKVYKTNQMKGSVTLSRQVWGWLNLL